MHHFLNIFHFKNLKLIHCNGCWWQPTSTFSIVGGCPCSGRSKPPPQNQIGSWMLCWSQTPCEWALMAFFLEIFRNLSHTSHLSHLFTDIFWRLESLCLRVSSLWAFIWPLWNSPSFSSSLVRVHFLGCQAHCAKKGCSKCGTSESNWGKKWKQCSFPIL